MFLYHVIGIYKIYIYTRICMHKQYIRVIVLDCTRADKIWSKIARTVAFLRASPFHSFFILTPVANNTTDKYFGTRGVEYICMCVSGKDKDLHVHGGEQSQEVKVKDVRRATPPNAAWMLYRIAKNQWFDREEVAPARDNTMQSSWRSEHEQQQKDSCYFLTAIDGFV